MKNPSPKIILTGSTLLRRRVMIKHEIRPGAYLAGLSDLIRQSLHGCEILDEKQGASTIDQIRYKSLPKRSDITASRDPLDYPFTMLLETLFLSTPIIVSYDLKDNRLESYETMRERIAQSVEGVRPADQRRAPWLPARIRRAKSFHGISRMIGEALS